MSETDVFQFNRSVRVTFEDGTSITTSINGTMRQIRNYYLGAGKVWPVEIDPSTGDPIDPDEPLYEELTQRAVKVEFLKDGTYGQY